MLSIAELNQMILRIPDYPKPGVIFEDITPILSNSVAFRSLIQAMAKPFHNSGITHVIGIEARGFLVGTAVAYELGAGFIPARKAGKLPRETRAANYELEYGTATIEIHREDIPDNARVLIVDDVLATGGTLAALVSLLQDQNCEIVAISVISEITPLNGRSKLPNIEINSLIS